MYTEQDVLGEGLDIFQFKNELLMVQNMERYKVIKTGKLHKHLKKWYNIDEAYGDNGSGDSDINDYGIGCCS